MTDSHARLRHPFDQYQRYRTATDLLGLLGVKPGSAVLDVGGSPGPAEDFLGDYDVTILDVDAAESRDRRFVLASGARLPFPEESFDAVLSQDTLEHVPGAQRPAFLSELGRVARQAVVLCAPFADPMVQMAERALHEFISVRFGGDFPTLEEHAEHGLPDLAETVRALGARSWPTAVLPSGYLPNWLMGMLVHHELLATGVAQLDELHAFYNATVSPSDCRTPSYRHVIVSCRDRDVHDLEAIVAELQSPDGSPLATSALTAIAQTVFSQRVQTVLGEPTRRLQERIDDLEHQLVDRDAHLVALRLQLDAAEARVRPASAVARDRLADLQRRWKEHR